MLGRSMETSPVTVTFPAAPEYLRLARIATADAASRAGLDYEEIDDVRIAVSELCSLVSVDADATVTLSFAVDDGELDRRRASRRTGNATVEPATSCRRRSSPPWSTSTRSTTDDGDHPLPRHEALPPPRA